MNKLKKSSTILGLGSIAIATTAALSIDGTAEQENKHEQIKNFVSYEISYYYKEEIKFNNLLSTQNSYYIVYNDEYVVVYDDILKEIVMHQKTNHYNFSNQNIHIVYYDILEGFIESKNNKLFSLENESEVIFDVEENINRRKTFYSDDELKNKILEIERKASLFKILVRSKNKTPKTIPDIPTYNLSYNKDIVLTNHAWWWFTRDTNKEVGYDELLTYESGNIKRNGLCGYIAFANIVLFNHIFYDGNLMKESVYKNEITVEDYPENINNLDHSSSRKLNYGVPIFRNHIDNFPRNSLANKLHGIVLKNGTSAEDYDEMFNSIVNKSSFNKNFYKETYDSWLWYTSYKKSLIHSLTVEATPVLLGSSRYHHVFVAFGYNPKTDEVIISTLWGNKSDIRIMKLSAIYTRTSDFYKLAPKNGMDHSKQQKLFKYDGKYVTASYFETKIRSALIKDWYNEYNLAFSVEFDRNDLLDEIYANEPIFPGGY
ncbi:putative cysteine peptidase [Mycoplasmopsis columboralis]|nr:hypothetical protein [Mycoplasmopsis columboralis]